MKWQKKIFTFAFLFFVLHLSAQNIEISTPLAISISSVSIKSTDTPIAFPFVNIVYPYENIKLPYLEKTFVFGNISPSTAVLKINGESINVYKNGGFIAYLPVSTGSFKFEAEIYDGISTRTYVRNVYISENQKIDISTENIKLIYPLQDLELMTGEYLSIVARAAPGNNMIYELPGIAKGKMSEYPQGSGYYYGLYKIGEIDISRNIFLNLKLKKGFLSKNEKFVSKYKIKIRKNNFTLITSTNNVVLKNDLNGGYTLFLPSGVKLIGIGKSGSMYKVKVGDMTLWVLEDYVNYLSDNLKEPKTQTGTLYLKKTGANKLSAQLAIYEKVPYAIYEKENSLILLLYYTNLHTNWVIYDSSDTFTENVSFSQKGNDVAEFIFNFSRKNKLWGYDIEYQNNSLNLNFKFKPEIKNKPEKPLEGLNIIIDPGHSPKNTPPFDGAIGPMGSFEYDVNLKIAKKLRNKLLNSGATVYMTRYGDENVPLILRPVIARQLDGDMFVSIHNNAIPDGEDPFSKARGFQIYFYHNHSMSLAQNIHKAFLKNIPLPDEGLRYGDYHVIRANTYMPAVLIENAYMIIPEQEEMLNNPMWQDKFAEAIKEGIINFIKEGK